METVLTAINVRRTKRISNTNPHCLRIASTHSLQCFVSLLSSGSVFNYDCYGCLETTGCYYCAGDGTCSNSPSYIYTGRTQSCQEPVDYIVGGEVCSLTPDTNVFSDPLYDGQKWVYDMINVVPVWEKGYFGADVRVRVNDDGVENTHPGEYLLDKAPCNDTIDGAH